ncbi:MAG: threonine synthase [Chitinophagaceae bacterium]
MRYHSTSNLILKADFREATIQGQAPDKGLYFPDVLPVLPASFFKNLSSMSREDMALEVILPYVGDTIPGNVLKRIVEETIDFPFPLVKVTENIYSLELFHGPTLAFKDVGARFMSRCLGYFLGANSQKVTVLVATSGDTGGAVANGFHDVDGVEVVILYPKGKVSSIQELQLTSPGKNIRAIEIDGNFDDCQAMVKQAFMDEELTKQIFLTSANSINVARWLPQQFYYFFALQQWKKISEPPVICVPSGNFGNICAGLMAFKSGLPAKRFIAGCNENNTVPEYLLSGEYNPKPAVATISNAMDVGSPSNFVRILEIFNNEFHSLKNIMSSYSISDVETSEVLRRVYSEKNYLLDPHGAVAYASLEKYFTEHGSCPSILLETAHPVKFYDVVEPIIGVKIPIPDGIRELMAKKSQKAVMDVDYRSFKDYLMSKK